MDGEFGKNKRSHTAPNYHQHHVEEWTCWGDREKDKARERQVPLHHCQPMLKTYIYSYDQMNGKICGLFLNT